MLMGPVLLGGLLSFAWHESLPNVEVYRLGLARNWAVQIITRAGRIEGWTFHLLGPEQDGTYKPSRPFAFEYDRYRRNAYNSGPTDDPVLRCGPVALWDFSMSSSSLGGAGHTWGLGMPIWLAILISLMPAAFWAERGFRRAMRRRHGRCRACGYDLRATADRCPECGMPATLRAKHRAVACADA
jgi:hypothetical protein